LTENRHVVPTAHLAELGVGTLEAVIDPGEAHYLKNDQGES
jgi:hypothetical protein